MLFIGIWIVCNNINSLRIHSHFTLILSGNLILFRRKKPARMRKEIIKLLIRYFLNRTIRNCTLYKSFVWHSTSISSGSLHKFVNYELYTATKQNIYVLNIVPLINVLKQSETTASKCRVLFRTSYMCIVKLFKHQTASN